MKKFLPILLFAAVLPSCNDSLSDPDSSRGDSCLHGEIVLGDRLDDPYAVDNINAAITKLYGSKADRIAVSATDRYVRFLPSSEADLDTLEALGVEMLDHPMDYEIVREGDWYHDPSVPDGDITWQYAVVPLDFKAPAGMVCEELHDVFLSDHQTKSSGALCVDWDAVERESFVLTGNGDLLEPLTKGEAGTPKGRVTILDSDFDPEPVGVAGVKVSANVFVKFSRCFTDDEGYYEMSASFSSQPRYRLVFSNRKGFNIGFNFVFVKASVSSIGRKSAAGCDITVTPESDDLMFLRCAVNNAGYDYFESCSSSGVRIKTPPSNLRVWLLRDCARSAAPMFQQGTTIDGGLLYSYIGDYSVIVKMFLPDLLLGVKDVRSYADVYHRTVHEMAHASHFMNAGVDYWDSYIKFILSSYVSSGGILYGVGTESGSGYAAVGEMWAYYVDNLLYKGRYPESATTYGYSYWFSPGVFNYLDSRGLNRFKIFAALTSDVHSVETLKDKLLVLYPECRSIINEAFARYI